MSREVRVGMMFVLSLVIFGTALYFLGSLKEMVSYKVQFDKVIGLEVDSPVQFRGVPIGRVTKIVLAEQVSPSSRVPINVTLAVHRSARDHIRTSTYADIRSVGVLGDKSILLLTRDYSADPLEEGGFIKLSPKALDVDKLLAQGEGLVSDATEIAKSLRTILQRIAHEEGPFQTLVRDKAMARDLKKTVAGAVRYMEEERNVLSLLMRDPDFAAMLEKRLDTTLGNVEAISSQYKDNQGLLPMLMADEAFKKEVQTKVLALLDQSTTYADTLASGKGLVNKMTQDEAYAERVSTNLEKASFHLASILAKIDEGDGTAALVVNDPSLYQGLYEVVYGLQHSGLSKWYIQRKQKKGAKVKATEEDESP